MGMNIVADLGHDCPSCRQYDRCTDDCICPACWWPARYASSERQSAATAWRFFAPVTKAMNDEDISWGWATEEGWGKRVVCSLELLLPDSDEWCEVARWGDRYVATHWRMKPGSRERNEPPEPVMLDELQAETPDEVINFIQNCNHIAKEKA